MRDFVTEVANEHLNRVRVKSEYLSAACPFHKGGQEAKPSFWINLLTGKWGCFTCETSGSSLKWFFIELGIRSASLDARLEYAEQFAEHDKEIHKAKTQKKQRADFRGESTLPEALLGVFDWLPEDLIDQGFTKETLKDHNVGYDQRTDRITFPIRDLHGDLIGISGRSTMIGANPKYMVYRGRTTDLDGKENLGELGEWYPDYSNEGVRDHLWGMDKCFNRIFMNESKIEELIVVEGFKARMWVDQHDWLGVVALMGAGMSPTQERIIRKLGVPTFVFLDNNEPGRRGSERVCQRLAVSTFPVYEISYPEHCDETAQPDDLNDQELEETLNNSRRVGGYRK